MTAKGIAAPLRYTPEGDHHNGLRLKPGDILRDEAGVRYRLDRNKGYMLNVDELDATGRFSRMVAISVDPTDKEYFLDIFATGENAYDRPV